MHRKPMTLLHALRVLADAHTREDDQLGYIVEMAVAMHLYGRHSEADYIEAWGVVRRELGLSYEPPSTGDSR